MTSGMRGLLISVSILISISAAATSAWADGAQDVTERYRYRIEKTLYDVKSIQPDCPSCDLFQAGEGTVSAGKFSPQCQKTYRDFYKVKSHLTQETSQDTEINISLSFGYMDFLKDVDDYYAALAFGTQMTSRCYRGQFACGFTQDPDDRGVFRKEVQMLGPDGLLRRRIVKLHMRYSSVTPDERLNRGARKADQDRRTESSRLFFADALEHSDMVMYVGHARDGGGPDFAPPVVSSETHRTDFDWYHQHHPGTDLVHQALNSTSTPPKIIGIFACYSQAHFYEQLRHDAPKAGLILSGNNEFEAAVGQAVASLDSVLGLRCEDDFKKSINVIKKINVRDLSEGFVVTPMVVDGLF